MSCPTNAKISVGTYVCMIRHRTVKLPKRNTPYLVGGSAEGFDGVDILFHLLVAFLSICSHVMLCHVMPCCVRSYVSVAASHRKQAAGKQEARVMFSFKRCISIRMSRAHTSSGHASIKVRCVLTSVGKHVSFHALPKAFSILL